jgi:alpha-tubulin suppressor-like RCC1 family protein
MAVSSEGEVYAWGKSSKGQIGIDSGGNEVFTPRKVNLKDDHGEAIRAVDVECGYEHSLVIALDGTVHFCGRLTKDEEVVAQRNQGELQ